MKTVLFQAIQFGLSTHFSPIWPIDSNPIAATTQSQSGPGSDGKEGVLHIPLSSSITGTSPSDCLVSYPGHLLQESYSSAELQLVYSTAPANWVTRRLVGGVLPLCRDAVSLFYSPSQLDHQETCGVEC